MKRIILFSLCLPMLILNMFVSVAFSQIESVEKYKLSIQDFFKASGWMGDGEYGRKYIEFEGTYEKESHSQPSCIKIKYTFGPKRWAGIYWQNKADNWGDRLGNDYSKKGFTKVTFWARGETGKEVVEFKAGEIYNKTNKYHDSFGSTIGRVTLSKEWKEYIIDLEGADLSSVIGGFCWVASSDYNSQDNLVFYIDDIIYQ